MTKILILTNYFLPGYKAGGPIKSISSLSSSLKKAFDITIMTSNHEVGENKPYDEVEFDQVAHFDQYKVIYLSKICFKSIKNKIKEINPNIIYLNSFFSKMTLIVVILKKMGLIKSRIILAPRGELSSGALSIKPKRKGMFLKASKLISLYGKNTIFHATDEIEVKDIKKLYLNKIVKIANLTSTINDIKIIEKEDNELKIIFLSRISSKKNLLFALKVLKEIDNSTIIFDIYGTLEDIGYWNECEKIINSFNNLQVTYKGSLMPAEIPKILNQYHVFFLPTLNENFGHAIVEAMQVGLVPIISDQTPWNDLEQFNAGWALALDEEKSFIDAIHEITNTKNDVFLKMSNNVKNYISMKLDNKKSLEMYKEMFEEVCNEK
jgi:glycosyltransferase involved in cell wall biosynthesis